MDKLWPSLLVMAFGTLIAGCSQILLKKAAQKSYEKWYQQYLNVRVVSAYAILVLSTLCSVVAYRVLPLSSAPVWTALGQVLVVGLSALLLGERPGKRKLIGVAAIVAGIVLFCL